MGESYTKQGNSDRCERYAEHSTEEGEEKCLGEELAEEAAAICAERLADGDVPAGFCRADEKKVGDVDTRDQQDENDSAHQA